MKKKSLIVFCFLTSFFLMNVLNLRGDVARNNYGALLEPVSKMLHGAGQAGLSYFNNYWGVMDSNEKPVVYSYYLNLKKCNDVTVRNFIAEMKAIQASYPNNLVLFHVGLSMVDGGVAYDGSVASGTYDTEINRMVDGFMEVGSPMYLRIGYEFNGQWNGYSTTSYINAFRRITNVIRNKNAEIATVWNFSLDASNLNYSSFYPGDSYVDWWSVNLFSSSQIGNTTCNQFLASAHTAGKPVLIAESTPRYVGVLDGQTSWNNWFSTFFTYLRGNAGIKGFCYINWNWGDFSEWSTWGDCRLEMNSTVAQNYRNEMSNSLYCHSSSLKNFRTACGFNDNTAPGLVQNLQWDNRDGRMYLNWDKPSTESSSSFCYYKVYRNGTLIYQTGLSEFYIDKEKDDADGSYQIKAIDNSGNEGSLSGSMYFLLQGMINGSFESGIYSNWSYNANSPGVATFSQESSDVQSGSKALKVAVTSLGTNYWNVGASSTVKLQLDDNEVCKVTLYAKSSVANAKLKVEIQHSTEGALLSEEDITLTTQWAPYTISLKASKTGDWNLKLFFLNAGVTYKIDNISLDINTDNLVLNGGFESGYNFSWDYYNYSGSVTYSTSTSTKYAGANALKAAVTSLPSQSWQISANSNEFPATGNTAYKVVFYAKASASSKSLILSWRSPTISNSYQQKSWTLTTSWVRYEHNFTPSSTSDDYIVAFQFNGIASYYLDSVKVKDSANFYLKSAPIATQANKLSLGENNSDLKIFPNPASSMVTIQHNFKEANVTIYSMTGTLVKSFNSSMQSVISLSDMVKGIYIVKVKDPGDRILTQQLVVK